MGDGDLLSAVFAETLRRRDGGLEVEIEIIAVNTSDPVAARPPLLTHVLPCTHHDESPTPSLRRTIRMLTVRSSDMGSSTHEGPG